VVTKQGVKEPGSRTMQRKKVMVHMQSKPSVSRFSGETNR
jgi:hypothetical protein